MAPHTLKDTATDDPTTQNPSTDTPTTDESTPQTTSEDSAQDASPTESTSPEELAGPQPLKHTQAARPTNEENTNPSTKQHSETRSNNRETERQREDQNSISGNKQANPTAATEPNPFRPLWRQLTHLNPATQSLARIQVHGCILSRSYISDTNHFLDALPTLSATERADAIASFYADLDNQVPDRHVKVIRRSAAAERMEGTEGGIGEDKGEGVWMVRIVQLLSLPGDLDGWGARDRYADLGPGPEAGGGGGVAGEDWGDEWEAKLRELYGG
ncbi:hypothetical protein BDW02DRAFT_72168 [Decorospora gaudefroyi]|uniref:Uncharacterized protein n=1 Tax=Decorospora gaudefroyi TaxID=184978 RepID=A0A6A5K159_9PLEO|nr:hypothetical protein BDW02DRAFT_72168 [Decorospora gaudefroyi]